MQRSTTEQSDGRLSEGSLLPLDTLGGTIKAHIAAGDKASDKAAEHYKAAGIHLSEAKERVARTKGLTWPAFLKKNCSIGSRRADELIAIGQERTSLVAVRAAKANSMRGVRERRSAPRGAQSADNLQQDQVRADFVKRLARLLIGADEVDIEVIERFITARMNDRNTQSTTTH